MSRRSVYRLAARLLTISPFLAAIPSCTPPFVHSSSETLVRPSIPSGEMPTQSRVSDSQTPVGGRITVTGVQALPEAHGRPHLVFKQNGTVGSTMAHPSTAQTVPPVKSNDKPSTVIQVAHQDEKGKVVEETAKPQAASDTSVAKIDLLTALRLADTQNPEIALARERIREAYTVQRRAEMMWLPNVEVGPVWQRHDGQIQRAAGEVITTSRSSLFVGGGPTLSLDLGEAMFAALAARQVTAASQAGADAVALQRLLSVALSYTDLLQAYAELQINEETVENARRMVQLTESYERTGKGAAADTARARTELRTRESERYELEGRVAVTSARLAQLLYLPPDTKFQPVDQRVFPLVLIPETTSMQDLLAQAMANRPEVAEGRALTGAAAERLRASRFAPLVPELRVSAFGGGFGGGINSDFRDFNTRSDVSIGAIWEFSQMGLGDVQNIRQRDSQLSQVHLRLQSVEAGVANEVVAASSIANVRKRELDPSQRAVEAARESYRLNDERIRRAPDQSRPIELLQSIQALARARFDYLMAVSDFNRAQFRLYAAVGNSPTHAVGNESTILLTEPVVPSVAPMPRKEEKK